MTKYILVCATQDYSKAVDNQRLSHALHQYTGYWDTSWFTPSPQITNIHGREWAESENLTLPLKLKTIHKRNANKNKTTLRATSPRTVHHRISNNNKLPTTEKRVHTTESNHPNKQIPYTFPIHNKTQHTSKPIPQQLHQPRGTPTNNHTTKTHKQKPSRMLPTNNTHQNESHPKVDE